MALRVIGAGLARTGTTSLKLALEQMLGGPCYHMFPAVVGQLLPDDRQPRRPPGPPARRPHGPVRGHDTDVLASGSE